MAYVSVPKDLTKVKNKVAFNLTKRQLICIGIGAAMGIPSYFLLRNVMGNSNAATVMVLLMLPAFLFAMYEKDGMHLEDVLMHMIRVKFLRPPVRKYETENYYESLDWNSSKLLDVAAHSSIAFRKYSFCVRNTVDVGLRPSSMIF